MPKAPPWHTTSAATRNLFCRRRRVVTQKLAGGRVLTGRSINRIPFAAFTGVQFIFFSVPFYFKLVRKVFEIQRCNLIKAIIARRRNLFRWHRLKRQLSKGEKFVSCLLYFALNFYNKNQWILICCSLQEYIIKEYIISPNLEIIGVDFSYINYLEFH